ncbi:LOW QUALITY PROTEIN: hypothetical protein RJ640_002033 [Escallonia rubra]|uniref:CRC domain-containing protein n=1 Tax=Escallonia rubra TaxID=112253 RepID=A0AA88RNC8_9ASTE|nr:LOW QUALITY PROTEIN: hypothetical protein RJ640_002033 [Escallonia rubra]
MKFRIWMMVYLYPEPKSLHGGESESCKRCNCKKSKCLKLYCECFAAGLYCVEPCSCQDCHNKPMHEETVLETRKQIESRNPLAFAPKVIRSSDSVREFGVRTSDEPNTPASARHKRGCNCKKSSCLKKYCECYQVVYFAHFISFLWVVLDALSVADVKDVKMLLVRSMCLMDASKFLGNFHRMITIVCLCYSLVGSCHSSTLSLLTGIVPRATKMNPRGLKKLNLKERIKKPTSQMPSILNVVHKGEQKNPDLVLPMKPLLDIGRPLVRLPLNLSSKLPQNSLPDGSSPQLFTSQKLKQLDFFGYLPKIEKRLERIPEDETPEILKSSCSPTSGMKAISPNRKRVSPPHRKFASSTAWRSGRKLILRSIPSFPSLAQHENSDPSGKLT